MIVTRLLRALLWSAALLSGTASAVGFGEINLHSRIGEPIRAELPILSSGDQLDVACFSLGNVPGADFPVITAGRLRLVRIGQDYRLIITGSKPIAEPIYLISVRAACGIDLQREYILLPSPPLAAARTEYDDEAAPTPPPATPPRKARRVPDTWQQDESGEPIKPVAKPRRPKNTDTASAPAKRPAPRETLASLASGNDRVILGSAPEALPSGSSDPLAPVNALEERLLKMETSLHLLNEEVDKLNTALTLNAESRTMRQKLQDMQAQATPPGFLPNVQAAPPQAPNSNSGSADGWVELVLGVLLGGSVSATVAHLVSRRQNNSRPFDAPPPRIAKPGKQLPR